MRQRQRRLAESQHREHAVHLRQVAGQLIEWRLVERIAKELVERLLQVGQRFAQLVHHAAHDLVITDPAVQLFHPFLKRFRLGAGVDPAQPAGQTGTALGHAKLGGVHVFVGGLQIQHRSGHFQRNRRRRCLAGVHRGLNRLA